MKGTPEIRAKAAALYKGGLSYRCVRRVLASQGTTANLSTVMVWVEGEGVKPRTHLSRGGGRGKGTRAALEATLLVYVQRAKRLQGKIRHLRWKLRRWGR